MAQTPAGPSTWLLVVAAPAEARAVLKGLGADEEVAEGNWRVRQDLAGFDVLITGVGKANAAGATARALDLSRHQAVLSIGVAGALPGSGLAVGDVVAAEASTFADEGLLTPERFLDCHAMGFPFGAFEGAAVPVDPRLLGVIRPLSKATGPIATVSTCAGVDALAAEVRARTGALAEAMEGAAVGLVANRLGAPFAELRVISNTTGDRAAQTWDLKGALARLEAVVAVLATARAQVR
jgi:futalosine hydrolase